MRKRHCITEELLSVWDYLESRGVKVDYFRSKGVNTATYRIGGIGGVTCKTTYDPETVLYNSTIVGHDGIIVESSIHPGNHAESVRYSVRMAASEKLSEAANHYCATIAALGE